MIGSSTSTLRYFNFNFYINFLHNIIMYKIFMSLQEAYMYLYTLDRLKTIGTDISRLVKRKLNII